MATYAEVIAFREGNESSPLRNKIRFALAVKAQAITDANPAASAESRAWALDALVATERFEATTLNYLLAKYRAEPIALISAIGSQNTVETDAAVQGAVNDLVDKLLGAA
jgi:hypothetical protein